MSKQNPSILFFFFRVKVDAPLSSADVKFLLNQRKETKFVIASFFMSLDRVKQRIKVNLQRRLLARRLARILRC